MSSERTNQLEMAPDLSEAISSLIRRIIESYLELDVVLRIRGDLSVGTDVVDLEERT